MVTLSPPTSEARVRFMALSQVGKLVVACRWSAVYSTEPINHFVGIYRLASKLWILLYSRFMAISQSFCLNLMLKTTFLSLYG